MAMVVVLAVLVVAGSESMSMLDMAWVILHLPLATIAGDTVNLCLGIKEDAGLHNARGILLVKLLCYYRAAYRQLLWKASALLALHVLVARFEP